MVFLDPGMGFECGSRGATSGFHFDRVEDWGQSFRDDGRVSDTSTVAFVFVMAITER